MCDLVGLHLFTFKIAKKKFFDFNTYDIELWSVRFGKKLKIVILYLKMCHLVQKGRFTHKT